MAIMAVVPLTFISCGDDDDNEDVSGGNIVGTWLCDVSWDEEDDFYFTMKTYTQFKSDGNYVTVTVTTYLEDFFEMRKGDTEIDIEKGMWKTDGDMLFSTMTETTDPDDREDIGKTEKVNYKVNGNKLILTSTSGLIISVTYTRVSDNTIEKYLK